jgi:S1-C subfamily serine protease
MTFDPAPHDQLPSDPAGRYAPPATWRGPDEPTPPDRGPGAGSLRLALGAAIVSAVLASGGTAALLLATVPAGPEATPVATPATAAATATPVAADTVLDVGDAIADVVAATEPSVVTIAATGFGRNAGAGGSGIVVSADGLILTTAVVAPADGTYDILLADDREGTASVVASDASRGLVLLRTGLGDLRPARLAAAADLVVGQRVVAIGSPLGEFTDTVTSGIISSLGRAIDLRDLASGRRIALDGLIQTDAAINAGSSGGPLLDIGGTVVGVIATSASTGEGIGFAIPIEAAADLLAAAGA